MPASARVDRVPDVLIPSTSRFPFVHSQAWNLFPADACWLPPFLFERFRDRPATFQARPAVDRPCGAISSLRLQSPRRWRLGKSCRVLAEPPPRDRVPTRRHSRGAKEQLPAEDLQLRLTHSVSTCAPELAGFLRQSYGRDILRSRAATPNATPATLRSGFRRTGTWRGQ